MKKSEVIADEYFRAGFNCAQSVAVSFLKENSVDRDTVLKMCTGFAAGLGYKGKTCGAVIGAYVALGYWLGVDHQKSDVSKAQLMDAVKEFDTRFIKLFKSQNCKDLLDADVSNPEELKLLREGNVFATKCPEFVKTASLIADEILKTK